jgi:hypothetical protein
MPSVFLLHDQPDSSVAARLLDSLSSVAPEIRVLGAGEPLTSVEDQKPILCGTPAVISAVLVIVGPWWLSEDDSDITGALSDPRNNTIYSPLETVFATNVPIVPIVVQNASDRWIRERPSLTQLSQWPAIELRHNRWNDDVARVVERVEWILSDPSTLPCTLVPNQTGARNSLQTWMGNSRARFDQMRRRVVPRTKYWRTIKRVCIAVLGLCVLSFAYDSYRYTSEADLRALRRIVGQLSHGMPTDAMISVFGQIHDAATRSNQPAVVEEAATLLRSFVSGGAMDDAESGRIRSGALEALKRVRANDLTHDFPGAGLKGLDLFGADLSSANLRHVNFEDAELERVKFTNADLTDANLSATYVRNADFTGATVAGANITELDWYNAKGFSDSQLQAVRSTPRTCPKDRSSFHTVAAFRAKFDDEYDVSWEDLEQVDKTELAHLWDEYSKPGGLCERIDRR